jgi:hypothetical protein
VMAPGLLHQPRGGGQAGPRAWTHRAQPKGGCGRSPSSAGSRGALVPLVARRVGCEFMRRVGYCPPPFSRGVAVRAIRG